MTLGHAEGARILVVDDDPLLVRLVRTNLEKAGYRVLSAADGEQAVDVAANELSDFRSSTRRPSRMGASRGAAGSASSSMVPWVVMPSAARGEPVDRAARGFEMGADDYVSSPFVPGELLARVRGGAAAQQPNRAATANTPARSVCGDIAIDLLRRA